MKKTLLNKSTVVKCPNCGDKVIGRVDKKFCSTYCKSNYHYTKTIEKESSYFNIDRQLKLNRRILKDYNRAGKATVRTDVLIEEGFNERYITHWWKNNKGDTYLFCYEFGFLKRTENGKSKYVLIQWQDYMN